MKHEPDLRAIAKVADLQSQIANGLTYDQNGVIHDLKKKKKKNGMIFYNSIPGKISMQSKQC